MFTFAIMPDKDQLYMHRCIELARFGLGSAAPNPIVGAVVVHNGRIIGEGWHRACGEAHAEVNAIGMVKNRSLMPESTLYVNLEPCNHQGRTPRCSDLILRSGIRRVVIGQADPNPSVTGGGVDRLRKEGVEVITGMLEDECRWLNRRFNVYHLKKRPYLILKWAQTSDGFVDNRTVDLPDGDPAWITDEACRRLVHKWRTEEPAILAGSRTILLDNPKLNVRAWTGRNPMRITIDRQCCLIEHGERKEGRASQPLIRNQETSTCYLLDQSQPTLIFTEKDHPNQPNLEFIRIRAGEPVWPRVLGELYNREVQSVLIEGGPTLIKTLIEQDLWDEARVFTGPGWFGKGVKAPDFPFHPAEMIRVGNSEVRLFNRAAVTLIQ